MPATAFIPARENPFAVEHVTHLDFRFPGDDEEPHFRRLEQLEFCAAVVGPQGSGKTTLLDQLGQKISDRFNRNCRYFRVSNVRAEHADMCRDLVSCAQSDLILLDSAEKLSSWHWRRLVHRCKQYGLIVATHSRCRLPTWIRTTTSPGLLRALLRECGYPVETLSDEMIDDIFRSQQGNLRDALRFLYDQVACGELAKPPKANGHGLPRKPVSK